MLISGGVYVIILCLFIIMVVFITLYSIEVSDNRRYREMISSYCGKVERSLDEIEVLVDLSDSLREENDELTDNEEYLNNYIDEQNEKLEEKEKRIRELEERNDKLCEQLRRLFDANPLAEEK